MRSVQSMFVLLALVATSACRGEVSDEGGPCVVSDDCAVGLVCSGSIDTRTCTLQNAPDDDDADAGDPTI